MKVIPFTLPMLSNASLLVHHENLPNFYKHLHRHPEVQIIWIIKGKGDLLASSNMTNFVEDDIIVLGSNQEHVLKANLLKEKNQNIEVVHIYFNPLTKPIKELLDMPELNNIKQFITTTNSGLLFRGLNTQPIIKLIDEINKSKEALKISNFIALLDCMAKTKDCTKLSISNIQKLSDDEGTKIDAIYQYTLKHYNENVSIDKIAQIAHMTPESFCRYFKKHTLKTYHNFLNEIRIQEACRLIVNNPNMSVSMVANETGFSSSISFIRVFKKIKKTTPFVYQRKYLTGQYN